ncbi:MAG: hypothetical protein JOY60_14510 [Burkholderiaceae bacterium]|nr:hypothetical protein [Roseateles sp.]MBV8471060.1 hypothetical protein [Burkholderiaceae bacterium]
MKIIHALIAVGLAGGGYHYWKHHREHAAAMASGPSTSAGPFVALPPADGQDPATVFVVAAQNCPHADAQRADRLAEALAQRGIPVQRTHDVRFHFHSRPDSTVVDRMNGIMNGPLPVVFVRGRAKSNPSLDEVIAEFKDEHK